MGRALLLGWEKKEIFSSVTIIDPYMSEEFKKTHTVYPHIDHVTRDDFTAIVIATKPQTFDVVLPPLKKFNRKETFFLSIAAGKTAKNIEDLLGKGVAVVRTMPNTPAMVGKGMSACFANQHADVEQKQTAHAMMEAVGDVIWLENEEMMHAVTSVSGSGPAYVFAVMEAMQKAGEAQGLDPALSAMLARKTVEGAAALSAKSPDKTPEDLRRMVTSPGGTTAAALASMQESGLDDVFEKALKACAHRSVELSS